MGFIFGGLLITGVGFSMIFAQDFWWELTELGNQCKGQTSERSDLWGCSTILTGVLTIGSGLCCVGLGLHEQHVASQPVIPEICYSQSNSTPATTSEFDRYIKVGCTAAQKKEYKTASTNFQQALVIIKHKKISKNSNDVVDSAMEDWSRQQEISSINRSIKEINEQR